MSRSVLDVDAGHARQQPVRRQLRQPHQRPQHRRQHDAHHRDTQRVQEPDHQGAAIGAGRRVVADQVLAHRDAGGAAQVAEAGGDVARRQVAAGVGHEIGDQQRQPAHDRRLPHHRAEPRVRPGQRDPTARRARPACGRGGGKGGSGHRWLLEAADDGGVPGMHPARQSRHRPRGGPPGDGRRPGRAGTTWRRNGPGCPATGHATATVPAGHLVPPAPPRRQPHQQSMCRLWHRGNRRVAGILQTPRDAIPAARQRLQHANLNAGSSGNRAGDAAKMGSSRVSQRTMVAALLVATPGAGTRRRPRAHGAVDAAERPGAAFRAAARAVHHRQHRWHLRQHHQLDPARRRRRAQPPSPCRRCSRRPGSTA